MSYDNRRTNAGRLMDYLLENEQHPTKLNTALAQKLGMKPSELWYAVEYLENAGHIEIRRMP